MSFLIELVDGCSFRRHQDYVRICNGNSELALQPEEHEILALQEEFLIDAFTQAADEGTALVPVQPGPPTSEDEIKLSTSANVTSFSALPLMMYPREIKRNPIGNKLNIVRSFFFFFFFF